MKFAYSMYLIKLGLLSFGLFLGYQHCLSLTMGSCNKRIHISCMSMYCRSRPNLQAEEVDVCSRVFPVSLE